MSHIYTLLVYMFQLFFFFLVHFQSWIFPCIHHWNKKKWHTLYRLKSYLIQMAHLKHYLWQQVPNVHSFKLCFVLNFSLWVQYGFTIKWQIMEILLFKILSFLPIWDTFSLASICRKAKLCSIHQWFNSFCHQKIMKMYPADCKKCRENHTHNAHNGIQGVGEKLF